MVYWLSIVEFCRDLLRARFRSPSMGYLSLHMGWSQSRVASVCHALYVSWLSLLILWVIFVGYCIKIVSFTYTCYYLVPHFWIVNIRLVLLEKVLHIVIIELMHCVIYASILITTLSLEMKQNVIFLSRPSLRQSIRYVRLWGSNWQYNLMLQSAGTQSLLPLELILLTQYMFLTKGYFHVLNLFQIFQQADTFTLLIA